MKRRPVNMTLGKGDLKKLDEINARFDISPGRSATVRYLAQYYQSLFDNASFFAVTNVRTSILLRELLENIEAGRVSWDEVEDAIQKTINILKGKDKSEYGKVN